MAVLGEAAIDAEQVGDEGDHEGLESDADQDAGKDQGLDVAAAAGGDVEPEESHADQGAEQEQGQADRGEEAEWPVYHEDPDDRHDRFQDV